MKVAVFHSSRAMLGEEASGGGVYETAVANIFDGLARKYGVRITHFVPRKKGFGFKKTLQAGRDVREFRSTFLERVVSAVPGSPLARAIERTGLLSTARYLRKSQFRIAYFTSPSPMALRLGGFPYLFTVWDHGQLDLPGFLEVWQQSTWIRRERIYALGAGRASHVFVDSGVTGQRLQDRYGIAPERWSAVGLMPSAEVSKERAREIKDSYLIYPAKTWPHKNHVTLLAAFAELKKDFPSLKLVLTGGKGGNEGVVEDTILRLELNKNVVRLGHIDRERLLALIQHSDALVMPTLLGPTNLPPLEALQLGTPAIISDVHSFGPELDSMFLKVPPHDPELWVLAIRGVLEKGASSPPRLLPSEPVSEEHWRVLRREFAWLMIAQPTISE